MRAEIRIGRQILVLTLGLIILSSFFSTKIYAQSPLITLLDDLFGVTALDKDHAWVVGYEGKIFYTPDGGKTWESQKSGTKLALYSVKFMDEKNGLITGQYGTILLTEDGGKSWRRVNSGTEYHLFSLCYADDRHAWTVGDRGTVLHSPDGGKTWQDKSIPTWGEEKLAQFLRPDENPDVVLNQVYFYDALHGWIIGEFAHILYTDDGGLTWQPRENFVEEIPTNTYFFDITFRDAQHGYISGLAGTTLYTDDGGQSWKKTVSHTIQNILTVGIGEKGSFALGSVGVALQCFHNPENGWKNIEDINTVNWLREVVFSPERKVGWVVGGSGTVFKTEDGGNSWQRIFPPQQ